MIQRIVERISKILEEVHPAKLLLVGYFLYILAGWVILLLPICQKTTVHPIDHLFTAASSVSTTGLATLPIGESYSFLGQLAILIMIQLGGFGYATVGSFIVISTMQRMSSVQEKVSSQIFPLPRGFVIHDFIKHVIAYTLVCEAIGALILAYFFKEHGFSDALWEGVFHSVSAFSTAGISLFSNSFESYQDSYLINLTLSCLCILGGMGFIVWVDLYKRLTGKNDHTSFTTRIIASVTFWFLVIGTTLFFLTTDFPEDQALPQKILASFFQTMTSSTTAGFNTIPIGSVSYSAIILLLFLMTFGSSPSGTGGGLKSTTFAALLGHVKSTLNGKDHTTFWQHEIAPKRMQIATSSFIYYLFVLATTLFFLTIWEDKPFLPLLFEAASALTTCGLSMGITSELSNFGKSLIILLMFMGRVGILTFGIAITMPHRPWKKEKEESDHDLVF